ncbi:MAG: DUF4041 domain-containing protein [Lachnospiraceae bacterium]|nr:DUF4041 domain-containing protein [Lachnospiraceae bacterium]
MGLTGIFKEKEYQETIARLQAEINCLNTTVAELRKENISLNGEIAEKDRLIGRVGQDALKALDSVESQIASAVKKREVEQQKLVQLSSEISEKQKQIIWMDDEILVQSFGLYTPHYVFSTALEYKDELTKIRAAQKLQIKNKTAVSGNQNWTVNGSKTDGRKMVSDTQKLLLRAFNVECDDIISNVKYSNYDASLNKINKAADAISKLGTIMHISISAQYLRLKQKELRLAFEYQQKKQQEKEDLKAARAEQREQAKIQKELEAERKKIEKEQTHYQTAFEKLNAQLVLHPDDADLIAKKEQLEEHLSEIGQSLSNIDYRQANMKAGYVYIISNIGAFGQDVYKIGMTRRLDPQERVDELGDASVPFNFDVHAMIFSDDAPALEAALHRAFADRKLNMVNTRREFFNVTLDEIKQVIRENYDKTVEFIDIPDAEQFRISQKMRQGAN